MGICFGKPHQSHAANSPSTNSHEFAPASPPPSTQQQSGGQTTYPQRLARPTPLSRLTSTWRSQSAEGDQATANTRPAASTPPSKISQPNATDKKGLTNFMNAVIKGRVAEARQMMEQDSFDPNVRVLDGRTAMHYVAKHGRDEICEKLVRRPGVEIDVATADEITPLYVAAQYKHTVVAVHLLWNGADVNHAVRDRTTPLHRAAENGDVEMIDLLLRHGASVETSRADGATPLFTAAALNKRPAFNRLYIAERANEIKRARESALECGSDFIEYGNGDYATIIPMR